MYFFKITYPTSSTLKGGPMHEGPTCKEPYLFARGEAVSNIELMTSRLQGSNVTIVLKLIILLITKTEKIHVVSEYPVRLGLVRTLLFMQSYSNQGRIHWVSNQGCGCCHNQDVVAPSCDAALVLKHCYIIVYNHTDLF